MNCESEQSYVDKLEDRLDAVVRLHKRVPGMIQKGPGKRVAGCRVCWEEWPCETIKAAVPLAGSRP